jgi:pyruvate carboxylase subunit B
VAAANDTGNELVSTPIAPQTSGIDIPAPTPGNIVRLEVEVGDTISKEQTLLVMEAMKMESEVKSPQVGVVQAVHVKAGNTVQTGDALLTLRG